MQEPAQRSVIPGDVREASRAIEEARTVTVSV
jgi:hypothetical protein